MENDINDQVNTIQEMLDYAGVSIRAVADGSNVEFQSNNETMTDKELKELLETAAEVRRNNGDNTKADVAELMAKNITDEWGVWTDDARLDMDNKQLANFTKEFEKLTKDEVNNVFATSEKDGEVTKEVRDMLEKAGVKLGGDAEAVDTPSTARNDEREETKGNER